MLVPSGSKTRTEVDRKVADTELPRQDPLWPNDMHMSNTELLYACLIKVQAMRQEMAGLQADIRKLQ
ncbi:hypothetical protein BV20DRAFT_963837 [Pilatotrama ljubarskyi]|nr:hypothetical protein BV20DRAFT_963837 [Pilatotrama ljubarskyi]